MKIHETRKKSENSDEKKTHLERKIVALNLILIHFVSGKIKGKKFESRTNKRGFF